MIASGRKEREMPGRELAEDDLKWLEEYRTQVIEAFTPIFLEAADRFSDGERLLKRFNEALDLVSNGSSFRAVDEVHNEPCIAKALLANTKPRFSSLAYEPRLPGCAKSIDFRASSDDGCMVFVDVKTIKPEARDRWEQFERALKEGWFPENIVVAVSKE
jgi:hypothetical protein